MHGNNPKSCVHAKFLSLSLKSSKNFPLSADIQIDTYYKYTLK